MAAENPLSTPYAGWSAIAAHNSGFASGGNLVLCDGFDLPAGVTSGDYTTLFPVWGQGDADAAFSSAAGANSYSPNGSGTTGVQFALYQASRVSLANSLVTLSSVKGNVTAPAQNNSSTNVTFTATTGGICSYPGSNGPGYGSTGLAWTPGAAGAIVLSWYAQLAGPNNPASWFGLFWDTIGAWFDEADMEEFVYGTSSQRYTGMAHHFAESTSGSGSDNGPNNSVVASPQPTANAWHHSDWLINADMTMFRFLDGTLIASLAPNATIPTAILAKPLGLRIISDVIAGAMTTNYANNIDWIQAWVLPSNTTKAGITGGGTNPNTAALLAGGGGSPPPSGGGSGPPAGSALALPAIGLSNSGGLTSSSSPDTYTIYFDPGHTAATAAGSDLEVWLPAFGGTGTGASLTVTMPTGWVKVFENVNVANENYASLWRYPSAPPTASTTVTVTGTIGGGQFMSYSALEVKNVSGSLVWTSPGTSASASLTSNFAIAGSIGAQGDFCLLCVAAQVTSSGGTQPDACPTPSTWNAGPKYDASVGSLSGFEPGWTFWQIPTSTTAPTAAVGNFTASGVTATASHVAVMVALPATVVLAPTTKPGAVLGGDSLSVVLTLPALPAGATSATIVDATGATVTTGVTGTTYTVSSLTPGSSYQYGYEWVTGAQSGLNTTASSPLSTAVTIPNPAPGTPSTPTVALVANQPVVTFPALGTNASSTNFYRQVNGTGSYILVAGLYVPGIGQPTNAWTDLTTTAGNSYKYKISWTGSGGEGSESAASGSVTVVPVPATPPALVPALTSDQTAVTIPFTLEANASTVSIMRAVSGSDTYSQIASGLTSSPYIDGTVAPGQSYTWFQTQTGSGGTSDGSPASASVMVPAIAPSGPSTTPQPPGVLIGTIDLAAVYAQAQLTADGPTIAPATLRLYLALGEVPTLGADPDGQ